MNPDESDKQLWQLLGKAKQPAVSPFFARNVLRAVRGQQQEKRTPFAWLHRWTWRVALACVMAVAMVSIAVVPTHKNWKANDDRPQTLLAQQVIEDPDYEVINQLDELLAYEESSVWLDDSIH
jgi:anti-sigma-K factor RskA